MSEIVVRDRSGRAEDTMCRVGAWLVASITEGPVSRRVGVDRRRLPVAVPPIAYDAIPRHTRHWQEKLKGKNVEPARTVYTVGAASLSRQGRQWDLSAGGAECI